MYSVWKVFFTEKCFKSPQDDSYR
uniref:Uncharacterized protein n=1 Tax=Anguilla anguilla TaxID=7936 RepID=A0A0E9PIM4_ANGAN